MRSTVNSRRASSPLVRLAKVEGRWEAPDHPQDILPQNWRGRGRVNSYSHLYGVLKSTANDRRTSSPFPRGISDEAHFWLNGYVNKQNCRIWSEANLQVCVETPLHPEKLTVWCALWAGGILLQKR
ncbi:uncharacterized protein TNCV_3931301 [Trichonephila clavipes]|nr:uncharacterized protein TNCV_3931301 [Trichonephila clavipes]